MTDRDIEIGRLQAISESLRNQTADQYNRLNALEVDVATVKATIVAIDERLDALGAPKDAKAPGKLDWVYDRKTWMVLLAVLGLCAGWWNLDDIKTALGGP